MLRVFEISRMTNHNGPGIRTLVHFKGCPLRCRWCSTPESQSREYDLCLKQVRCIGDAACIKVCPTDALTLNGGLISLDRSKCTNCMACVDECYAHALSRVGREWSVDELFREILKDELFFRNSGGGVTFSGGEPLMFVDDEMISLYRRLHEAGITIGVDTTGYVPWSHIEPLLPYIDFFLWDLKVMDPKLHKALTGVENGLILENLLKVEKEAQQHGISVYIRCVQIPGLTDSDENLAATCDFLDGLKCIKEVHLVNLHHFGKKRYEFVGRPYPLDGLVPLTAEVLMEKVRYVTSRGLICKIDQ